MKLTIDNFDGAGARDYTANIDADASPRIQRRLNRPSHLTVGLIAAGPDFVVPASGARIVLAREDGIALFTGYTSAVPDYEYLGWGERGPAYRYSVAALSDEFLLDRRCIADRAPFVDRTAGDILRQLVGDTGAPVDTTQVDAVDTIPSYSASQSVVWSEHARRLALRARGAYRVHDGKLSFSAVGKDSYVLDENAGQFSPDGLRLSSPDVLVNDLVVTGAFEPAAYIKDYFLGDGYTLTYYMSHTPYLKRHTFFEDEYESAAIKPHLWKVIDTSGAISISSGKLRVSGGSGADGGTTLTFVEQVELGEPLMMQHGEVEFGGASNGLLGGMYNGSVDSAHCLAGFRVQPSGAQSTIAAIINGGPAGTPITTQPGHRYALVTRISGTQPFRQSQRFHSSKHVAGDALGGDIQTGGARLVLEVHDIDPNDAGTLVNTSTVLYDGVIANVPAYCTYALVNSQAMQCTISYTRLSRGPEIEVATTLPGQGSQRKIVGALAEGAHCQYSSSPAVRFFSASVPASNEAIRVSYRTGATATVRIIDPASVVENSRKGDDGTRIGMRSILAPSARTSSECEIAALALLDDLTSAAWKGEYRVWNDCLPQHADDFWPGNALAVNVPSRSASFTAVIREVEIECADLVGDHAQYTLKFANDAAEPLAFEFDSAHLGYIPDVTATTETAGNTYIADLPLAEVTAVSSVVLSVNTGSAPPAGGGFEVRRSDTGWGMQNDRNLVGRFSAQTFALPRLSRSQTYYLRQYDASAPAKYSRYSTALHIDYPL